MEIKRFNREILLLVLGVSIIILQVNRSANSIGIECEKVHPDTRFDLVSKIENDKDYCLNEVEPEIRKTFQHDLTLS